MTAFRVESAEDQLIRCLNELLKAGENLAASADCSTQILFPHAAIYSRNLPRSVSAHLAKPEDGCAVALPCPRMTAWLAAWSARSSAGCFRGSTWPK